MTDFPKRQLLINYLLGICTSDQQAGVEHWLDKAPGHIGRLQRVARQMVKDEKALSKDEKKEIKHAVMRAVEEQKKGSRSPAGEPRNKPLDLTPRRSRFSRRTRWIKVAAMVLVILTAAAAALYYSINSSPTAETAHKLQQRTLSNGQTATLRFAEGSIVNLNAGSTLRYPNAFAPDKREVYLEGEAFFSVSPDNDRPFIVHAGSTMTRVLGTSFNIKAYSQEDNVQVAVAEGKVIISENGNGNKQDNNDEAHVVLTKNEWVNYRSSDRRMQKKKGNIRELIAWRDGKLVFNDKSLSQIAKRLERWYNIEVQLRDSALASRRMSASFTKESMGEVLTIIALSLDIRYQKEGKKIIFYKND